MPRQKKSTKTEIGELSIIQKKTENTKPVDKIDIKKTKKQEPLKFERSYFGGQRILLPYSKKQDNGAFMPSGNLSIEIIGKSGSGKSHYLLSLIPQIKISQLVIFSLIDNNPIYNEIEKYCDMKNIDYHFGNNLAEAQQILEDIRSKKDDDDWGLIVMDDFCSMTQSRDNPLVRFCNTINGMWRNYHYHCCYITQSATMVNTLFRNNSNVRVIFAMNDKFAIESIKRDFVNMTGRTPEEFDGLYRMVKEVPHSFLQIADDKVFIYINEKMDELEEVEFQNSPSPSDSDDEDNCDSDSDSEFLKTI